MERPLVRNLFPLFLLWVWALIYLATGGLRLEIIEVRYPPAGPTEAERLEVRVLFQNASSDDSFTCRWNPPSPSEPLSKALRVDSKDGELIFTLIGFEVPAGYHRLDLTDATGVPLATRVLYIPPRPPQYVTRIDWEESGLLAAVNYRHCEPGARLAGSWSYDGRTILEAEREVTLGTSCGSAAFHLDHPPDGRLSGGRYEFTLLAEGMFVSRTVAPPQLTPQ
ncbi:MAG: hypothetical protein A2Y64_01120 [Candidatus Coatesbacteria bacterium RBG_13_66_14]|uniref:Uncharacterized protein n=1 Tax=Candidatus Coatesbacteria bacterium RBG_13_66_14 TaxID=1817816 RepID=A0A1F5FJJ0_9BACT|nr:MAG: hypothetical protein A2Y64_01120 [Candidatus Coatesbacteria bacterium RBG_13_66_14]